MRRRRSKPGSRAASWRSRFAAHDDRRSTDELRRPVEAARRERAWRRRPARRRGRFSRAACGSTASKVTDARARISVGSQDRSCSRLAAGRFGSICRPLKRPDGGAFDRWLARGYIEGSGARQVRWQIHAVGSNVRSETPRLQCLAIGREDPRAAAHASSLLKRKGPGIVSKMVDSGTSPVVKLEGSPSNERLEAAGDAGKPVEARFFEN